MSQGHRFWHGFDPDPGKLNLLETVDLRCAGCGQVRTYVCPKELHDSEAELEHYREVTAFYFQQLKALKAENEQLRVILANAAKA